MSASNIEVRLQKIAGRCAERRDDHVAVEEPLELRLGFRAPQGHTSMSLAVTMRTPGNDEALAIGFLVGEGIVRRAADIAAVNSVGPAAPETGCRNVVRVDLAAGVRFDPERLQRNFYTTSSCGVCGKSSLDAVRIVGAEQRPDGRFRLPHAVLVALPEQLRRRQATFEVTGGLHAAAAFTAAGDVVCLHEDVGRHNAVDKVVGDLLQRGSLPADELGLLVSGRASFELMQKAVLAGMPLLAAVSAPSSLAIRLAKEFNVTLVGFLRGDTYNVYNGEQRIDA